jgi:hypothetical protein
MGFPALVEIHLDAVVADKRLAHFRVGSRCTSKLRAFPVNLNASRDPTAGLGTAQVGSRDPTYARMVMAASPPVRRPSGRLAIRTALSQAADPDPLEWG